MVPAGHGQTFGTSTTFDTAQAVPVTPGETHPAAHSAARTKAWPLKKLLLITSLALCAIGMVAGAAAADPGGDPIELTCGEATFSVVTSGNGQFTPAHDVDSNTVFIPLSFGEFHGTIRDADDVIIDDFTEPATQKGKAGAHSKDTVSCTYVISEVGDGSDFLPEGWTFVGEGTVVGTVAPRR